MHSKLSTTAVTHLTSSAHKQHILYNSRVWRQKWRFCRHPTSLPRCLLRPRVWNGGATIREFPPCHSPVICSALITQGTTGATMLNTPHRATPFPSLTRYFLNRPGMSCMSVRQSTSVSMHQHLGHTFTHISCRGCCTCGNFLRYWQGGKVVECDTRVLMATCMAVHLLFSQVKQRINTALNDAQSEC